MKQVANINCRSKNARRSGFSLVEILIVIGIMMLLMAMGVFGYRSLERSNSEKQTKTALANAEAMLKEMNAVGATALIEGPTDRQPPPVFQTASATDVSVDVLGPTSKNALVMAALLTNPKNKTALQNLPSDMQLQKPGGGTYNPPFIADAWRKPLVFVPSGGLTGVKFENSGTQTVKSPSGRGFWASGGPDGSLQTGDDNVYSFQ